MSGLVPRLFASTFLLAACAGDMSPDSGNPGPTDCAEVIFTRACAPGTSLDKCQTCSSQLGCHGKDTPATSNLDLSASGLAASEHGKKLVNAPADDVMGSCGAAAKPPLMGKVLVDPDVPENSLLYRKVTSGFDCGSRMPFTATKFLSAADQQCILDWIKKIPGVHAGGAGADAGGTGG